MARYPLNLPVQLKTTAEQCATQQGISLNQFILWAVAEKVGELKQQLDDPAFPHVTYRRGAGGQPTPVVRGAGIRVQTLAIAAQKWGWGPEQLSEEYGVGEPQVREALAFYETHQEEIAAVISAERSLEDMHD
jgi:uncharacterized protein (DUF433 family)